MHPVAFRVSLLLLSGAAFLAAQEPSRTNSIGMEFVRIRPGSMIVGRYQLTCPKPNPSPPGKRGGSVPLTAEEYARCQELIKRDNRPGFPVKIDHPFYMGKFEVTQGQWKEVMGGNPSVFQGDRIKERDPDRYPVDNVTWDDAQAFVTKLNAMEKVKAYRLPTEFEWEYAARAGADEAVSWSEIGEYSWYSQNMTGTTHPVGQKKPNAWGLYDMVGNVWEWVQDWYNEKTFADPTPPKSGKVHVLRGASFSTDQTGANYFFHGGGPADGFDVGFRIVMNVK